MTNSADGGWASAIGYYNDLLADPKASPEHPAWAEFFRLRAWAITRRATIARLRREAVVRARVQRRAPIKLVTFNRAIFANATTPQQISRRANAARAVRTIRQANHRQRKP